MRAGWGFVALSVIVSMSVAFGITLLMTPTYESRAKMVVFASGGPSVSETYQGNLFAEQRVAAYSQLVTSDVILSKVIADRSLDLSASQLADKVTTSIAPDVGQFDVIATDGSAERARDIANTIATELTAVVRDLETPGDGEVPSAGIRITDKAEASVTQIRPDTAEYLAIGAVVGLLIGIAVALVRHRAGER